MKIKDSAYTVEKSPDFSETVVQRLPFHVIILLLLETRDTYGRASINKN